MLNQAASRWEKCRELQWHERRILVGAVLLLPTVEVAIRVFGYRRTHKWIWRFVRAGGSPRDPAVVVSRVARLVGVAAHHGIYRANCLRQALVTSWMLARRGVETKLVIGVRKDRDGFAAHAWVEYQGEIIIGGKDSTALYQQIFSHDPCGSGSEVDSISASGSLGCCAGDVDL